MYAVSLAQIAAAEAQVMKLLGQHQDGIEVLRTSLAGPTPAELQEQRPHVAAEADAVMQVEAAGAPSA